MQHNVSAIASGASQLYCQLRDQQLQNQAGSLPCQQRLYLTHTMGHGKKLNLAQEGDDSHLCSCLAESTPVYALCLQPMSSQFQQDLQHSHHTSGSILNTASADLPGYVGSKHELQQIWNAGARKCWWVLLLYMLYITGLRTKPAAIAKDLDDGVGC